MLIWATKEGLIIKLKTFKKLIKLKTFKKLTISIHNNQFVKKVNNKNAIVFWTINQTKKPLIWLEK